MQVYRSFREGFVDIGHCRTEDGLDKRGEADEIDVATTGESLETAIRNRRYP